MQLIYIVFIHSHWYIDMYVLATYIHYDYLITWIYWCIYFRATCIHIVYTLYTHCMQHVFSLYTHCIHIAYTLSTREFIIFLRMYTHCKQHVYTLSTHESVFLQCAYQLQIRCIYSVYTITGADVHTHMQSEYTSAYNIFSRMRTYTRAYRLYLDWLTLHGPIQRNHLYRHLVVGRVVYRQVLDQIELLCD